MVIIYVNIFTFFISNTTKNALLLLLASDLRTQKTQMYLFLEEARYRPNSRVGGHFLFRFKKHKVSYPRAGHKSKLVKANQVALLRFSSRRYSLF